MDFDHLKITPVLEDTSGHGDFRDSQNSLDPRLQALEELDELLQKMLADCTLQEVTEAYQ